MRSAVVVCLAALCAAPAFAAGAPAPLWSESAARAQSLSPDQPVSARDMAGAEVGRVWMEADPQVRAGRAGLVVFRFGESLPVLVCAPLRVCDIALEAGEKVRDVLLGDSERWEVQPATSGPDDAPVTHVVVKPLDSGLETSLLVTTDRRAYSIKLIARQSEWTPHIAFSYPASARSEAAWAGYRAARAAAPAPAPQAAPVALAPQEAAPAPLDFGFTIVGSAPWRPARVWHDGARTTIEMQGGFQAQEAPALVVLDEGGAPGLVNYRLKGGRYIVDGLFREAALISGVGAARQIILIRRTSL